MKKCQTIFIQFDTLTTPPISKSRKNNNNNNNNNSNKQKPFISRLPWWNQVIIVTWSRKFCLLQFHAQGFQLGDQYWKNTWVVFSLEIFQEKFESPISGACRLCIKSQNSYVPSTLQGEFTGGVGQIWVETPGVSKFKMYKSQITLGPHYKMENTL